MLSHYTHKWTLLGTPRARWYIYTKQNLSHFAKRPLSHRIIIYFMAPHLLSFEISSSLHIHLYLIFIVFDIYFLMFKVGVTVTSENIAGEKKVFICILFCYTYCLIFTFSSLSSFFPPAVCYCFPDICYAKNERRKKGSLSIIIIILLYIYIYI